MDAIFFYRHSESANLPDGILNCLKIAIQPNISVAGWPTQAGSNALAGFHALEDAAIFRRIREAGAEVCGSTHMSEFGFGLAKSSAGQALMTQAVEAELVLDLMGESRLAAARACVWGFKPSWGLLSHFGVAGLLPSLECCGILSNNINNIRSILITSAGPDERDFSMPQEELPDFSCTDIEPSQITIGVVDEAQSDLSAAQRKMFAREVESLKKQGLAIKELSFSDFSLILIVHKIIGSVEASSSAGRYDSVRYGRRVPGAKNWNEMYMTSRGAAFGSLLKSYLISGAYFQFQNYAAYENACRLRARLLAEAARLFLQTDFLLLPAFSDGLTETPLSLAATYAQFATTAFANVLGLPALYLPPAAERQVGLQLAGPRLSDGRLINLGEYVQNLRRGGGQ